MKKLCLKNLCLAPDQQKVILDHCRDSYPLEACGLLIGWQDVGRKAVVTAVITSENLASNPENAFEIDPALILAQQKASRQSGGKILGHYHSHPDGTAAPSLQDQKQNYDPGLIWMIVSVNEGGCQEIKTYGTKSATGSLEPIPLDLLSQC